MEFRDLLDKVDEAWISSQEVRERSADELLFARVTQWDDPFLNTQLEYRGQFDMIRKARRHNLSEMRANPVQVSYIASTDGDENTAKTLEKMYRSDMSSPAAKQAGIIAQQDQIDCGNGAWRLSTDYTNGVLNEQYIKREPIHEANNRVFWDPNANMPDMSDAEYCFVIWTITDLGWAKFAESIGVDPDDNPPTFRPPEDGYVFPWTTQNKTYNVGEFYQRSKVKKNCYVFENDLGEEVVVKESDIDSRIEELEEGGFIFVDERKYDTYEVKKFWLSGGGILNGDNGEDIAGKHIPIIQLFGEVSKVESNWVWEGIVRLAKDPQRLRNFMLSYIADIAAKGSRQRPYFGMSQIQGLEWQFQEGGPDQNRAFRVLNDTDEDGNPLTPSPVAYEKPPEMPQAAVGLLDACNGSIADVTGAGVPLDVAQMKNMAEGTIHEMNTRADYQTYTYIDNFSMALQREAEVYASMAQVVYDTEREVSLLAEDGTETSDRINKPEFDWITGSVNNVNSITSGDYKVRTKVTMSYASRKTKERAELLELHAQSANDPEAQNVIMMELLSISDSDSAVLKDYARNKLLIAGLVEPETEEEAAMLEQMQAQQQEPDANMVLAQAEQMKAQAMMQKEQRESMRDAAKAQNDQAQTQIDSFEAQTDRMDTQINAQKAGAEINYKKIEALGKQIENAITFKELRNSRMNIAHSV